ncbi:TetR family transcriptional regulator [Propionibacteriaceae bacterium G57]|uniref:TetR/AcrR family transcriptional regulator n=1 Tax=Aestuariimicrobium sp. G57 TaxID=3418485 RepID=UPI003DA6E232
MQVPHSPDDVHGAAGGETGVEMAAANVRGPRGPRGEVRERIRAAAHRAFSAEGYASVTVRQIAGLAECDPAMIRYYFGSKQQLFRACFDLPVDPAVEFLDLLLPDPGHAGERIVRHALELYDDPSTGETMASMMRALVTDAATSQRFRGYIHEALHEHVASRVGRSRHAAVQVELAMAQLLGMVTMRYVVGLEPLASMPREQVVAELAPVIQHRIDRALGMREGLRRPRGRRRR